MNVLNTFKQSWFWHWYWFDIRFRKPDFVRLDKRTLPYGRPEIRLFAKVRNEIVRLPHFFKHYRRIGVDRFFVIDNGSSDGTTRYLLSQPDTHVFWTESHFSHLHSWTRSLLSRYGLFHWCVMSDADEFFIYPHQETLGLRELSRFMENEGSTAIHSYLMDMYADSPIAKVDFPAETDPINIFPFFDMDPAHLATKRRKTYCPHRDAAAKTLQHSDDVLIRLGGMRRRVFQTDSTLSKIMFFKCVPPVYMLHSGHHTVNGARLSRLEGVVRHFKYASDFVRRAPLEAERGQYSDNARRYESYRDQLLKEPDLNLHYKGSVKYESLSQLVSLGLMKSSQEFDRWAERTSK